MQAYFGNTEYSVLSYKRWHSYTRGMDWAKQVTELGRDGSAADHSKGSCFTVVISLQKTVRAFLLLPHKTRISSQVRFLPGGLFSLLLSFELCGMLSISLA